VKFHSHNVGTMRSAYNTKVSCCGAGTQRLGAAGCGAAGAGAELSGNAESAGAAALAFGIFGFFGRIILRIGLGGGPKGCSSATTGLGSTRAEPALNIEPELTVACTGTVAVWNLFMMKVTEKPFSGGCSSTEQGVLQPGPMEVRASAPGGVDSSWT